MLKKKKRHDIIYQTNTCIRIWITRVFISYFNFLYNLDTAHSKIKHGNNRVRFLRFLDDGNIGSGVFVDLQKTFNTVHHQMLLGKLNHYEICGGLDDSFKS